MLDYVLVAVKVEAQAIFIVSSVEPKDAKRTRVLMKNM
jgi:hypothetical protein